jgi:hypothetical protein
MQRLTCYFRLDAWERSMKSFGMKKTLILLLLTCALSVHVSAQPVGSLTNGLIGYYSFDGSYTDSTGNTTFSNSGTTLGSSTNPFGGYLAFDYGQYGSVAGLGPHISNSVTVSGWYYFTAGLTAPMEYGSGFKAVPFSGTLPDGSNPTFRINGQVGYSSPQLHFQLNLGDTSQPLLNPNVLINTDEWRYVTVTALGGVTPRWRFYLDGILQAEGLTGVPASLNFNYDYGLGISLEGGGYYFGTDSQGGLANMAFYNRELSTSEVSELHNFELVPEPSTYALLLFGGTASVWFTKRRRR